MMARPSFEGADIERNLLIKDGFFMALKNVLFEKVLDSQFRISAVPLAA
jgi:hypothetical protein